MSSNLRQYLVLKKSPASPPSPKHTYLVSRSPNDSDFASGSDMVPYSPGDDSPQRPQRSPDGSFLPRSILGDSQSYESIDSQHMQREVSWGTDIQSSSPALRSRFAAKQRSKMQLGLSSVTVSDADDNEAERAHPADNREAYELLVRARHARAIAAAKKEKEAAVLEEARLSTRQKFDRKRDQKILSRWAEQQSFWLSAERRISQKLRASPDHVLLMSSIDEFRAKTEEYDALQLAKPIPDRFGSSAWEMDLRGGGSRMIPTGSVIAGLESNIKFALRDNPIVRKPAGLSQRTLKNDDVSVTPSQAIIDTRMRLRESLRAIRPHIVSLTDADELAVRAEGLFEWAQRSSGEHYDRLASSIESCASESEPAPDDTSQVSSDASERLLVVFHTICDALLSCERGKWANHIASFTNKGSIALAYSWKRSPIYGAPASPNSDCLVRETIFDRDAADYPRAHLIAKMRPSIFCRNQDGVILPGETVHTEFRFIWREHGGVVSQTWLLETNPPSKLIIEQSLSRLQMMAAGSPPAFTPVQVTIRGVSLTEDESAYRRQAVGDVLERRAVQSFVELEIYRCIRRVRSPVSKAKMERRTLALFAQINEDLLRPLQPVFLSAQRLEAFFAIFDKSIDFTIEVNIVWRRLKALVEKCSEDAVEKPIRDDDRSSVAIALNRQNLFPEAIIEVFDEIEERDVSLRWNMDLTALLGRLKAIGLAVADIVNFEKILVDRAAAEERAEAIRLKMETKASERKMRRAARREEDGSDYEDSEDEEEEEDERQEEAVDEDALAVIRPRHGLEVLSRGLMSDCQGLINMMMLRECACDTSFFPEVLLQSTEIFAERHDEAALAANIPINLATKVSTVERGGMEFWNQAQEAEQARIAAGGGKGKRKGAVPSSSGTKKKEASPEQIDAMFLALLTSIKNDLMNATLDALCRVDCEMEAFAQQEYAVSGYSSLPMTAVLRSEDFEDGDNSFQGKVAFVTLDESLFLNESLQSAFDWSPSSRFKMLSTIRMTVQLGIRAIVILYETKLCDPFEEIGNNILVCLSEYLNMDYRIVKTFCSLSLMLQDLVDIPDFTTAPCPVFFVRNIANPEVVPEVPSVQSSDTIETEVIPIGLEEHSDQIAAANRIKKVLTRISGRDTLCSPIAAEALADAFQFCEEKYGSICVNGNLKTLYDINSVLSRSLISQGCFITNEIRETALWASVLLEIPHAYKYNLSAEESVMDSLFVTHFMKLFPNPSPSFCSVVGGTLRQEKFKLIDRLIDIATSIIIVGEIAIPVLAAISEVAFAKHTAASDEYRLTSLHIVKKARMRGVHLLLPIDLLTGDVEISESDRLKPIAVDLASRDDGIDYEGDTTIVRISNNGVVDGFVYDIGPETIHLIVDCIAASSVTLYWGSAGVCEFSSFQNGSRAVVEIMAAKVPELPMSSSHSLVIGDSTVEWFCRIADSDGDLTNGDGDLVKASIVDYAQRCSALTGLLRLEQSHVLSGALRRQSNDNEWYDRIPTSGSEDAQDEDI